MKIIFIGKNTTKPKSINLAFVVFLLLALLALNLYFFNYLIEKKNSVKLGDFELTASDINHGQDLNIYVDQIGESLNARLKAKSPYIGINFLCASVT